MTTYVKFSMQMVGWLRQFAGHYPKVTNVVEGDAALNTGAVYFDVSTMTASEINKFIRDIKSEMIKVTTEIEQLPT